MTEPLLTNEELQAMETSAVLFNQFSEIVGRGPTRQADLTEVAFHIHGLQNMVLAQAASRAFPDRYRLMGGTLGVGVDPPRSRGFDVT